MCGDTDEIIRHYLSSTFSVSASDLTNAPRTGVGEIRFTSLRFEDEHGDEAPGLISGHPARIVVGFSSQRPLSRVRICLAFLDSFNQRIMYLNSYYVRDDLHELPPGPELICEIPRVQLSPGRYRLEAWIQSSGTLLQDRISDAGTVDVMEGNFFGTGKAVPEGMQLAMMDYSWKVQEARHPAAAANGTCVSR
jgi:lipopolysaccharide transport system ATP-binding protein